MEYRIPRKGEIYRHFKGNLYEIILIARDSETLEEKVVYKEVDGDAAYVRSLPMFVSYVDKEKYPGVQQEFRFELVNDVRKLKAKSEEPEQQESCIADRALIMEFLEIDKVEEKIQYLQAVKDQITDEFLAIVAQSMDFVENEGNIAQRYDAILKYLRTIAKYESGRLR